MKKTTFLIVLLAMSSLAQAQVHRVAKSGSLETVEIAEPYAGKAGYEFHMDMINGHYSMERALDYDSLNMTFLGNWPMGVSYSLIYSGVDNIFMLGTGGGVMVLDVTDPANPLTISVIKSRSLVDCATYDPEKQRLYLGAYFSGVEIWDLSDIQNPSRLARIPTNSYPRGGIYAEGDLLYVMSVADGIYIYDLADLSNIPMIGHYPIPSSTLIWNSAKYGNLMFCAANNNCRIVDVGDPSNTYLAGAIPGVSTGVYATEGKLYQVSYNYGLKIWNVSNPASPQLLGQIAINGYPVKVVVQGNYAFVASSTTNPGGGLRIIDVSDPTNPQEVSSYPGYADFVAVNETFAMISGGSKSEILDINNIVSPQLAGSVLLPGWVNNLCVKDNLGFTGSNGFRVFDLADKSNPVQIGYHETQGDLVAVSGNLAVYIPKSMGASNPVNVMDITDPTNPSKRGHYMSPVMTYDINIKNHYAFIACWWDGFRVVDFSNPDNPTLKAHKLGWYTGAVPGVDYCFAQALDIEGNFLYVIDYMPFEDQDTRGIYIFDISNPENPVFIKRFAEINSKCNDISVEGNYAYLADGLGGVEVVNVADPNNPFIAGYVYTPDGSTAIEAKGNYAYVANYILGGVQMVDISFPANPLISGYYKPSGVFALGVSVQGSHVYIADGIAGFQVYDNLIITGNHEPAKADQGIIEVHPNPASANAFIDFQTASRNYCKLSLFDNTGREVKVVFEGWLDAGNQKFELRRDNLNAGIYLVNLKLDKRIETQKLLIMD